MYRPIVLDRLNTREGYDLRIWSDGSVMLSVDAPPPVAVRAVVWAGPRSVRRVLATVPYRWAGALNLVLTGGGRVQVLPPAEVPVECPAMHPGERLARLSSLYRLTGV